MSAARRTAGGAGRRPAAIALPPRPGNRAAALARRRPARPAGPDWLGDTPQAGARRVVLDLLDAAQQARERLPTADPEALHDFRVAVRRLRSALRTFADELGESAVKRERRRWSDLAATTGPGRDAEAQRDWLAAAESAMTPAARAAARALRRELEERLLEEAQARASVGARFERLAARLRDGLATYTVRLGGDAPAETFAELASRRVRELGEELAADLERIEGPRDEAGAHRARIAGKRLRYGLEIAAPGARPALARLKTLQDLLGELHDVHGLMARAAKRARREARQRARRLAELVSEAGLAGADFQRERRRRGISWWALLDALRLRQDALHSALASDWLGAGTGPGATLEALLTDALGPATGRGAQPAG